MNRRELKRIQKRNTSKYASENENGYCWYECLEGEPVVTFQKGDTLAMELRAWKPDHPWSHEYDINKHPITVAEANQFGELVLESIEDDTELNSFNYSFYIKFKKKITSEEFIPVIYTLTNNLMNENGVTPRQHWVESVSKHNANNINGLTFWYTLFMGT